MRFLYSTIKILIRTGFPVGLITGKLRCLLLLSAITVSFSGQAAFGQLKETAEITALDYLDTRKEVYLRTTLPEVHDIATLSEIVSIDRITDHHIYFYANRKGFRDFESLGLHYEVLIPPSLRNNVTMSTVLPAEMEWRWADSLTCRNGMEVSRQSYLPKWNGGGPTADWDTYPTFKVYVATMQQFALDYPEICLLDTIGFSKMDRPILVVKISDQVAIDEPEPDFFYSSTMHGDELSGYVLMIRLIDCLLKGYDSIPKITDMVDRLQIWINPLANPDGTYFSGDHTVNQATRGNSEGIDLNRDFPSVELGTVPENCDCEPETKAMMDFLTEHRPVISANIHSGAELVNYPWDNWSRLHADDEWFRLVSRQYADTVHLHAHKNPAFEYYFTHEDNGITNGFAWYYAPRTRQDYVTYYLNGREVTLEISLDKAPPARQLPLYWEYNYRSLLNYMEQCLYGFRGIVTDKETGIPVSAKVTIAGHDMDRSYVFSDSIHGRYYRPVAAGTYDLVFTAPGYREQKMDNQVIMDFQAVELDVQLEKQPSAVRVTDHNNLTVRLFENPFDQLLRAVISCSGQVTAGYCLYNLYGQKVTHPEKIVLQPGENSIRIDATMLRAGYYILRINSTSCEINRVVVKM